MKWPTVALDQLCEINVGRTPSRDRKDYWDSPDHPWVSIADMSRGRSVNFTKEAFSEKARRECNMKVVPSGTVLFSFKLSIGKVAIATQDLFTNEAIAALPVLDPQRLDAEYLARALEFLKFNDAGNRAVMGRTLNKAGLRQIKIPLPPLSEQRRIAATLDQADALRRLRRQSLSRLFDLGQAIFFEMFGDWSSEKAPWNVVELGDKLDFLTSGSRGWAEYYADAGSSFIRIQNVRRGYFDWSDLAHVNPPHSAEARRTKVQRGDVLLSITADLGRVAVVPDAIGDAHINQHLAILRTSFFNSQFLAALLTSPAGQRAILKKDRSAVKSGLNFDDIRSLRLIAPPRKMQDEFENRLMQVDVLNQKYTADSARVDSLFASLQHRAFREEL